MRIFIFLIFLDPKFPDFQVPKFWISKFLDFPIPRFPHGGRAGGGRTDGRAGGAGLELLSHSRLASKDFWKSGTWKSGNLGSKKIPKIKILKIKIRSAQNVGKVWISRKKNLPAPFGALPGNFLRGPEKSKKYQNFAYFPWWAHGPYSPGLGPLLLSTQGGAIGRECCSCPCAGSDSC